MAFPFHKFQEVSLSLCGFSFTENTDLHFSTAKMGFPLWNQQALLNWAKSITVVGLIWAGLLFFEQTYYNISHDY